MSASKVQIMSAWKLKTITKNQEKQSFPFLCNSITAPARHISFQRIIKRSLFLWLVSFVTDSTHSSHVQMLHLSLALSCQTYSDGQSLLARR